MGKRAGNVIRPLQYPPLKKYVIREKVLHHRHFLQYEPTRNQVQGYCKESGCTYKKPDSKIRDIRTNNILRTTEIKTEHYNNVQTHVKNWSKGKENVNPNRLKYDAKYPQNILEIEESPKAKKSLKYIMKPVLYSQIDEYFVENEKEDAQKRAHRYKQAKSKADIIKNFQDLYENHCRLIEAQNVFIHEHMQLVKARQLVQMKSEKARWMENHAQVFCARQHKNNSVQAEVFKQHKKIDISKPTKTLYRQYVSSL